MAAAQNNQVAQIVGQQAGRLLVPKIAEKSEYSDWKWKLGNKLGQVGGEAWAQAWMEVATQPRAEADPDATLNDVVDPAGNVLPLTPAQTQSYESLNGTVADAVEGDALDIAKGAGVTTLFGLVRCLATWDSLLPQEQAALYQEITSSTYDPRRDGSVQKHLSSIFTKVKRVPAFVGIQQRNSVMLNYCSNRMGADFRPLMTDLRRRQGQLGFTWQQAMSELADHATSLESGPKEATGKVFLASDIDALVQKRVEAYMASSGSSSSSPSSFAGFSGKCFHCGRSGHKSADCWDKKKGVKKDQDKKGKGGGKGGGKGKGGKKGKKGRGW